MKTREAAIYYDYLSQIIEQLSDEIDNTRSVLYETQERHGFTDTYLDNKLNAYMVLYGQLDDLKYVR